jgi:hypothetical protein
MGVKALPWPPTGDHQSSPDSGTHESAPRLGQHVSGTAETRPAVECTAGLAYAEKFGELIEIKTAEFRKHHQQHEQGQEHHARKCQ